MTRSVAFAIALLCCVASGLACVADASLATTPVVPPTQTRPAVAAPANLTPQLPAKPVAPAAGTYFGQLVAIDPANLNITFSSICLGADRKVMRALTATDTAPRVFPLQPTTTVTVFISPPGNPAAGRATPIDLPAAAEVLRNNPGPKWFLMVNPAGITALEQDSGVRSTPQPDDPCPHG